jgi:hypothetical protein
MITGGDTDYSSLPTAWLNRDFPIGSNQVQHTKSPLSSHSNPSSMNESVNHTDLY